MGLDITAYRKLTPVPDAPLDADGYPEDWDNHVMFGPSMEWSEQHWPGRSEGVDSRTVYAYEESYRFRAGSYGGYNRWRSELAELAGYEDVEDFWDRAPADAPFFELIHFADNEGTIGPVVSAKLAKDFADHADKVGASGDFASRYSLWRKAFEMAADGGAVDFH